MKRLPKYTPAEVRNDPYGFTYKEMSEVIGENEAKALYEELYKQLPLLGSGEINHSGSGENRQFWSNENHQSGVASPQVVLFTRPAAGQPVSQ